jgi:hypothetical protein
MLKIIELHLFFYRYSRYELNKFLKKNTMNSINFKPVLFAISFSLLLVSCGDDSSKIALAKKRIFKELDANAMGTLKDLKITNVEMTNDSTYKASHTFTNSIMRKEMRVTRNYFFTSNSDFIKNIEDVKIEVKSEGKWMKTGY